MGAESVDEDKETRQHYWDSVLDNEEVLELRKSVMNMSLSRIDGPDDLYVGG
jgi:hypothetical protein